MNAARCCHAADGESNRVSAPLTRVRRSGRSAGWMVPTATLVLMPKCPMCIAAYLAMISGVGISMATASYLRTGILLACAGWLLWLAGRRLHAFSLRRRTV